MIDFHTHILPKLDDGSQSCEESCQMLQTLVQQGVNTVALTPHFYARHEDPEQFLERRSASWERLQQELLQDAPRLLIGAEVLYFRGISRMEQLHALRLEGTRVLLLEMPFERWSDYMVQEIIDLSCDGELVVLLAHIDRYLPWQKDSTWEQLLMYGVKMQANAEFFASRLSSRRACRMLNEGYIHVLGTDCHNMTHRAPNMEQGIDGIIRRMSPEAAGYPQHCSRKYLEEWSI